MSEKEVTVFEIAKWIRQQLLTRVAEALSYNSWSDKFKLKNITEAKESILNTMKENGYELQLSKLTKAEMKELGFSKWSDGDTGFLIPFWMYEFLPERLYIDSSLGDKIEKSLEKKDIDNDHRFGYLAYSVVPIDAVDESNCGASVC